MKIVGSMQVCNEFEEEIDLVVGSLSSICDEVCFLTNRLTNPRVLSAIHRCPNVARIEEYTPVPPDNAPWNPYYGWDQAYHLANKTGDADWIIVQDQDDLLPYPYLRQFIQDADAANCDTLRLPPIHCWGSPDRIVYPQLNATGWHARAYKGRNPEFTVCNGGGFCLSPGAKVHLCNYPYRHLAFMTQSCRDRRLKITYVRNPQEVWAKTTPPVFPFRPDWTIELYNEITEEDCLPYANDYPLQT